MFIFTSFNAYMDESDATPKHIALTTWPCSDNLVSFKNRDGNILYILLFTFGELNIKYRHPKIIGMCILSNI